MAEPVEGPVPDRTVAIGLDIGTSGVKGVAVDETGATAGFAGVGGYQLSTPAPGWVEQDPEDWWSAAEAVLHRMLGSGSTRVAGIGLTGQMHGLVALDSADRVVRPAILWNDQRTAEQCEQIEQTIGLQRLIELTGNRAIPGFTAPKMLWMREHEPDLWSRVARVMLPKDYIRLRLCGTHATDVSDASGTLLFDVGARNWSADVLDALELDPGLLPEVLESAEVAGTSPQGVPVATGAGDQAAGALGVGVVRPGPLSVVLGTSGVVFAATEEFRTDPAGRLHAFCHADPSAWHVMGVMLSAAGSLAWARDTLAPEVPYPKLLAEAESWPAGAEGLVFLPYLNGERTPHVDPEARAAFAGLGLRHDRGALMRAVLEGVAFGLADCRDLITGLGIEATRGRVSGGGVNSRLWLEIVASALELPLEQPAVHDGAAFGAALLGGVAAGMWENIDAAIAASVKPKATIDPVSDWIEPYREARETFRALYPALRTAAGRPDPDGR